MKDGIVFIDKSKVILQLCAYKKQYYFVTKYTMFMDWKNQYSKNEYTTQSNL